MISILRNYFDLRPFEALRDSEFEPEEYRLLAKSDVENHAEPSEKSTHGITPKKRARPKGVEKGELLRLFCLYCALVTGIITQPYFSTYQQTGSWEIKQSVLANLLFSCVIGMILLPTIYRRSFHNGEPVILTYCTVYSMGIGWQGLFSVITKIKAS